MKKQKQHLMCMSMVRQSLCACIHWLLSGTSKQGIYTMGSIIIVKRFSKYLRGKSSTLNPLYREVLEGPLSKVPL